MARGGVVGHCMGGIGDRRAERGDMVSSHVPTGAAYPNTHESQSQQMMVVMLATVVRAHVAMLRRSLDMPPPVSKRSSQGRRSASGFSRRGRRAVFIR